MIYMLTETNVNHRCLLSNNVLSRLVSTIRPGTGNTSAPGPHHQSECTMSTDMTSGVGFSDNRRSECFGTSIRQENNLRCVSSVYSFLLV